MTKNLFGAARSSVGQTLALLLAGVFVACAHGEIENLEYPLVDLKSLAQQFFNGSLNATEDGGRDFQSAYFRPNMTKDKFETPRSEDNVRARALVRFIGNERPYVIQVWVEVQTKVEGGWLDQGNDSKLTKKVTDLLRDFIRARKDKNFIDNYRAF